MKFIIPQNYSFKNKFLGFIDYSTAIINVILAVLIYWIINIFHISLSIKISIFIVLFFPILLFSIIGFNGESIINVCYYLISYLIKPKVILFKK